MGVLESQDVNASPSLSFFLRPFEGASLHELARALFWRFIIMSLDYAATPSGRSTHLSHTAGKRTEIH